MMIITVAVLDKAASNLECLGNLSKSQSQTVVEPALGPRNSDCRGPAYALGPLSSKSSGNDRIPVDVGQTTLDPVLIF